VAVSGKKKAPAAKPVARRFKIAVPERMTIAFDTTRATWFNETTNAELRGWKGSEHELVARACRLSGLTPDRIVHQGVQLLAQRLIATALSDTHLTVTRGGIRGAADERLAAGYKALKSAGLADADITASRLGYACTPKVNYRTATAWLANHGLATKGASSAKATDDDQATIERLTTERTHIEAEIRVLSARLALGTDPLPDTTAATSALENDAQTPVNAPQTAGTAPTTAKAITPASDAPTPTRAPKARARKAATAKATTTRKTRGAA
jgi:hypothetical protein